MPLTSTFSTISVTQTDANSVLDTILMDAIRQDIDVLYEWLGGPTYTPSTSHNHNGVNSSIVSGSWVLLNSQTISSTALIVTSEISTVFDDYVLIGENIFSSGDNAIPTIVVSSNNGGAYDAGSYWRIGFAANAAMSGPAVSFQPCSIAGNINNSATLPMCFTMRFYNPLGITAKQFDITGSFPLTGTGVQNAFGQHMQWNSTAIVNAFKFTLEAGATITGTFKFYGINKT